MSKWNRVAVVVALAASVACSRRTETPAAGTAASPAPQSAKAPAASSPAEPAAAEGVEIGSAMPAYTAKTLEGGNFDIASARGQVVFLNLWATWCGPCRFEIPEIEAMHVKYGARGLKVVGVSLDEGAPDEVKKFVKDHKMTYAIALDPEGHLADLFETSVIPTSVLIDRHGKIVWKKLGIVSGKDEELTKALDQALAGS